MTSRQQILVISATLATLLVMGQVAMTLVTVGLHG